MPKTDSSAGRPRRSYQKLTERLRQFMATGTNCPRNGPLPSPSAFPAAASAKPSVLLPKKGSSKAGKGMGRMSACPT